MPAAVLMSGPSFPSDSTSPAMSQSPSVNVPVREVTSVSGLGNSLLSLVGVRAAGLASGVSGSGDDGIPKSLLSTSDLVNKSCAFDFVTDFVEFRDGGCIVGCVVTEVFATLLLSSESSSVVTFRFLAFFETGASELSQLQFSCSCRVKL